MKIQIAISLFVCLALSACASALLRVESSPPGADVILLRHDGSTRSLGRTPLELGADLLPAEGSAFTIKVLKDGFAAQTALVPSPSSFGFKGRLDFRLADAEWPKVCQEQDTAMNDVARGVAEISGLIQKRRLAEAEPLLNALILKFGTVASLYDLQGNVYFLQRRTGDALRSYRKSVSLAPNNPQTLKMIDRLSKLRATSSEDQ